MIDFSGTALLNSIVEDAKVTPAVEPAVKVGDVFYTSWGYDQTNVDYYKVIEVSKSGKTAKLRQVSTATVSDQGPYTEVKAGENWIDSGTGWCALCHQRTTKRGAVSGPDVLVHSSTNAVYCIDAEGYEIKGSAATPPPPTIYTKRIKFWDGKPTLNWNSYSNAYLWDGKPKYQTGLGWGH